MCYINGVKVSLEEFLRYKQHEKELGHLNDVLKNQPAKRGFDYSDWPIIKPSIDGCDWEIVAMNWGYLPDTVKTVEQAQRFRYGYKNAAGSFTAPLTTLNAKGEELLFAGKMFRQSALQRRCLVLSSGFYEHRHVSQIGKRGQLLKSTIKYPYHIYLPAKPVFMMAGIYNTYIDDESGKNIDTFAIVTTAANALMAQIHNDKKRMPVIFTDELADEWTNKNLTETRITELATFQFPAKDMKAHSVAKDFLKEEDPSVAFLYPALPELIIA
jgi:putative SOS response-associated peptidase YedK